MHNLRRLVITSLGTLASTLSAQALAFAMPLGQEDDGAQQALPEIPFTGLERTTKEVDFTATVALNNCSGSLIRFKNSKPTDKITVLTNGHCYEGGFLDPGEVAVDKPSSRSFRVLQPDGRGTVVTLRAERLVYATMTGTDMALYQVGKTYGELSRENGVEALVLSDRRPEAGDPMRVVSGYWKRIYACDIDGFIPTLREGSWTFTDSIKYTQPGCKTIGGTSGSPVVNAETKEVIGVNNTGNESGDRCTLNNPCEVDAGGNVIVEKGAAYGQQTYQVYSCLAADNSLDLSKSGCTLAKP